MGTPLKFEFDFDEVFEGIKQGVIRELSETNFDEAKESAINQIKNEVKGKLRLTYSDEYELKNEIKQEIKEKVFEKLIEDVDNKYLEQFEGYVNEQLCKNPERLEDLRENIIEKTSDDLYTNLYDSIKSNVTKEVKEVVSQLGNVISGNGIKLEGTNKSISKKEYEELLDRNRKLSALEAGGVDNWEWYSESLAQYYDGDNE